MKRKRGKNKKAQVTIFIILGIVVASLIILLYHLNTNQLNQKFGEDAVQEGGYKGLD